MLLYRYIYEWGGVSNNTYEHRFSINDTQWKRSWYHEEHHQEDC